MKKSPYVIIWFRLFCTTYIISSPVLSKSFDLLLSFNAKSCKGKIKPQIYCYRSPSKVRPHLLPRFIHSSSPRLLITLQLLITLEVMSSVSNSFSFLAYQAWPHTQKKVEGRTQRDFLVRRSVLRLYYYRVLSFLFSIGSSRVSATLRGHLSNVQRHYYLVSLQSLWIQGFLELCKTIWPSIYPAFTTS